MGTVSRSHIIEHTLACCCPLPKDFLIFPIYGIEFEHRFEFGFDLAFMILPYDIGRSNPGFCLVYGRGSIWSPVVPHILS